MIVALKNVPDRYTAINRNKKLDHSDFYSLPGLSWITVLAKTKI